MKTRISWIFLPIGIGLCLLSAFMYAADTSEAMVTDVPFIMLYGEDGVIDMAIDPFVVSGDVKFLREYPQPADYLLEGGLVTPPNTSNLAIRMFQVTTYSVHVQEVISQVISATLPLSPVDYVYPHFEFMSYIPREIVIHGDCLDVSALGNSFDPDVTLESLINMDYLGLPPALSECVGLYSITNQVKKVTDFTTMQGVGSARAEPNFITNGMMAGYGIVGSPAAMIAGAPPTSTSGTTPLPTTGKDVGVYLFDTSPYQTNAEFFTRTVAAKAIDLAHLRNVRLPASALPFNPNQSVAAHGTFVATPIVDLAPDTNIKLARILNQDGLGTQFDFALGVDWAIRDATVPGNDWSGVVFNYSLGLEDEIADQSKTALNRMLTMVARMDIVQVAAAGNDSAYESMPQPMDLPAGHPDVIGVTAIVPGNQLACYANASMPNAFLPSMPFGFAARGGGPPRGVPICNVDQFVKDCAIMGQAGCLHGWDPFSPTGYAYGIGTSFASPHVAAFAAQSIEALAASGGRGVGNWVRPITVLEFMQPKAIPDDPDMGNGYFGNWQATMPPTAIGLEQISAETVQLPILLLGLLLIALSGVAEWRRR